jgi:hypothetical protein
VDIYGIATTEFLKSREFPSILRDTTIHPIDEIEYGVCEESFPGGNNTSSLYTILLNG